LIGDAMLALGIAMVIFMALAAMYAHEQKAERQLAASRADVRAAEAALLALETGTPHGQSTRVERLPDTAPEGYAWVRVTVRRENAAPRSLVGLVAAKNLDLSAATGGSTP
jgi:hypothetical protein